MDTDKLTSTLVMFPINALIKWPLLMATCRQEDGP